MIISNLCAVSFSLPPFCWQEGWTGWVVQTQSHTYTYSILFFLLQEIYKLRDLPPFSSWVTHTRDKLMNGEKQRESEVYLTWLHLWYFSQLSNINRALDALHPLRPSTENCPDMTCCSVHTHTFIWIFNGNMPLVSGFFID